MDSPETSNRTCEAGKETKTNSPLTLRELVINFMAKNSLYLIKNGRKPPIKHGNQEKEKSCHCSPL